MDKPTSIYLDFVRFLAAATVFIVHANYDRFTGGLPVLWRFGELGNDAVMVFFVLSGFVIAYVADQKEKTLKDYFLSRLARLYSVTAPALVLTAALDYAGSRIAYGLYDGWWFQTDYPVWRFIANFFFVNEIWFSSVRPFSNGPFWSLGYEFWYYVIFAAWWYLKRPAGYFAVAAVCLWVGPKILMLLPVWLLGVWVYFRITAKPVGEAVGWALLLGSGIAYGLFRQFGGPHVLLNWTIAHFGLDFVHENLGWSKTFLSSYVIGSLVAMHFLGVAAVTPRLARIFGVFEVPIRYLAGYTFAIYLFHYPLLQFFAAATTAVSVSSSLRSGIVVSGTVIAIWILGTVTEQRKPALKKLLLSTYDAIEQKVYWGGLEKTVYKRRLADLLSAPRVERYRAEAVSAPRPGELLLEKFLKPMDISRSRLAEATGVPLRWIDDIVAGKRAITADTDLRLCRFLGLANGYWLRAQAAYDTEVAERALGDILARIKPWAETRENTMV